MSNSKRNALDVRDLLAGSGALTADEFARVASQYRTADRAESTARVRKARIAYVVRERGAMGADGDVRDQRSLALDLGTTEASVSQMADAYSRLVYLGVSGESDDVQRRAFVAADRIRKFGKSDAVREAVEGVLGDIRALPVGERVAALDAATTKASKRTGSEDGEMVAAVKAAKSLESVGTREASATPETTGEKSATGKADVLAALGAAVQSVRDADGVALTNGEADQVAAYLAALVVDLGVSLDAVTDRVAEVSAAA